METVMLRDTEGRLFIYLLFTRMINKFSQSTTLFKRFLFLKIKRIREITDEIKTSGDAADAAINVNEMKNNKEEDFRRCQDEVHMGVQCSSPVFQIKIFTLIFRFSP